MKAKDGYDHDKYDPEDYEQEGALRKEMRGKGSGSSMADHMGKHYAHGAKGFRKTLAHARAEHGLNAEPEDQQGQEQFSPEYGGEGGV